MDQLRRGTEFREHVGHPHPVKRSLPHAIADVEVCVGVEVDESDTLAAADVTGDRPDPDRAVTTQDERDFVRSDRLANPPSGIANDLGDLHHVLSVRMFTVRTRRPGRYPPAPGWARKLCGAWRTIVRWCGKSATVTAPWVT